ncbi:hypothetical protein NL676_000834 [Syzygium grande]|nr:hypothetical protein NL676_000834 [Syzygium grande]
MDAYKDGFMRMGSLVDVGGGTGDTVAKIVRSYPHNKGINLDQPRIVAAAPAHGGVCHVGGDMFEAIPSANAVFMNVSVTWCLFSKFNLRHDVLESLSSSRPLMVARYGRPLYGWILHDWNDEDCVRILKNCRKAVSEKNGKVIMADIVLQPEGNSLFDDTRIACDLFMITQTGGKERTEPEWKKILEEGGFPRFNIIQIPSLVSIIEAFPV